MPSAPRSPPRPHRLHRINVPIHRSQHQRGVHGAAFAAELHHWRERQPDIIRPVDKVGQALGAELARIGACKAVALRRCAVRQIDAYQLTLASLVDFWERGSHGFERCSPLAGTLRLTAVATSVPLRLLCLPTVGCDQGLDRAAQSLAHSSFRSTTYGIASNFIARLKKGSLFIDY